jgi:hypothetical protein
MCARNPFPSGEKPLTILFPGQIVSAFDIEPQRSGTWPPLSLEKRISILNEIQNHQKIKNVRLSLGKEEKTINSWLKVNKYTIVKKMLMGLSLRSIKTINRLRRNSLTRKFTIKDF